MFVPLREGTGQASSRSQCDLVRLPRRAAVGQCCSLCECWP